MKIFAPAKLNLFLHLSPQKRKDGLYPVKFLNCQLKLADEIQIFQSCRHQILCSHPFLKKSENLLSQLLELLPSKTPLKIILKKQIPVKAGLGGGSSDAGALLLALNRLWHLNYLPKKLLQLARQLGMDVCYAAIGGLALIEGAGEKIRPLSFTLPHLPLIIITPKISKLSTAWAYQNLDLKKIGRNLPKLKKLILAIKKKNLTDIAQNLHNDFESSLSQKFPVIDQIKNDLNKQGCLKAQLCGSGLSVFGLFPNQKTCQKAFFQLKKKYPRTIFTTTL